MALAHSGPLLASGGADSAVRLYALRNAAEETTNTVASIAKVTYVGHIVLKAGTLYSLALLKDRHDSAVLCAGCQDTNAYVMRVVLPTVSTGSSPLNYLAAAPLRVLSSVRLAGSAGFIFSLVWKPSPPEAAGSNDVVGGCGDGLLRVWRVPAGFGLDTRAAAGSAGDASAGFAPASTTASEPVSDMQPITAVQAGASVVLAHHTSAALSMASADKTASAPVLAMLPGGCGAVYALAAYGKDIYAACADGGVRVFDAASLWLKYLLSGHSGEVLSLCLLQDPQNHSHATASSSGHGHGGELGAAIMSPVSPAAAAHPLDDVKRREAFTSSAQPQPHAYLCSGGADGTLRFWSTRTYLCVRVVDFAAMTPSTSSAYHRGATSGSSTVAADTVGDALGGAGSSGRFAWPSTGSVAGAGTHSTPGASASANGLKTGCSPTVLALASHGRLLLASTGDGIVHALDAAAALLWRASEGGGSIETSAGGSAWMPPMSDQPSAVIARRPRASSSGSDGVSAGQVPPTAISHDGGAVESGATEDALGRVPSGHSPAAAGSQKLESLVAAAETDADSPVSTQSLLSRLRQLVSIPSISLLDGAQPRDVNACWRAARYLQDALSSFGAEVRLVCGSPGVNPTVLGRLGGFDPDVPAILLHAHYDVQPPGDMREWANPPFGLTGRDGFLYGRGASDCKGPLLAMLYSAVRVHRALQAQAARQSEDLAAGASSGAAPAPAPAPRLAFVFVFEGEGENGSAGFREAVLQSLDFFANTIAIINCNNVWLGEDVPCLTYGMRGLCKVKVEVTGSSSDLHSGLDGGVSHEPLQDLCALMGGLVDPRSGRIAVPGLYDAVAPLSPQELRLYQQVSDFDVDRFCDSRGLAGVWSSSNLRTVRQAAAGGSSDGGLPSATAAAASAVGSKRSRLLATGLTSDAADRGPSLEAADGAAATETLSKRPRAELEGSALADAAAAAAVPAGPPATASIVSTPLPPAPGGGIPAILLPSSTAAASAGGRDMRDPVASERGLQDAPTGLRDVAAAELIGGRPPSRKAIAREGQADSVAVSMNAHTSFAAAAAKAATSAVHTASCPCSSGDGLDGDSGPSLGGPGADGEWSGEEASGAGCGSGQASAAMSVEAAVLLRRWREPALSVHGIACSAANESIIPRAATAFLSVRTVPHMTSARTFELIAQHLRTAFEARASVNSLAVTMTAHAAWWLQSPAASHYQVAARAVQRHWGRPPMFVREGGTVRVTTFLEKTLKAPALHLPVGQSSDAPHLPNERIRLLNLVTGCRVLASMFLDFAARGQALGQPEASGVPKSD